MRLGGSCVSFGGEHPLAVGLASDVALGGEDGEVLANVAGMELAEFGQLGRGGGLVFVQQLGGVLVGGHAVPFGLSGGLVPGQEVGAAHVVAAVAASSGEVPVVDGSSHRALGATDEGGRLGGGEAVLIVQRWGASE